MRIAVVIGVLLLSGCGDTPGLCTQTACAKVEGSYAMEYEPVTIESPDCATLPQIAAPAGVVLKRMGSEVTATIGGIPARGFLQGTAEFSLLGTAETDGGTDAGVSTFSLRGYYSAGTAKPDAGSPPGRILGKWITHVENGTRSCDAERPFTGTKQ